MGPDPAACHDIRERYWLGDITCRFVRVSAVPNDQSTFPSHTVPNLHSHTRRRRGTDRSRSTSVCFTVRCPSQDARQPLQDPLSSSSFRSDFLVLRFHCRHESCTVCRNDTVSCNVALNSHHIAHHSEYFPLVKIASLTVKTLKYSSRYSKGSKGAGAPKSQPQIQNHRPRE